ncbi:MAG: M48 family metalloprotease [Chlamydiales bacterium]|jgi:Zn-dependent protease with chaperone function|nr:M48 family metalloprotease [Chlamydiales bacterium]
MSIILPSCISTSWEYTKSTRPYQAFESLANKVMNVVYPENAYTKRRSFTFIPSFIVHALGYLTYCSECPSYQTLKVTESDPNLKALVKDVHEVFDTLLVKVKEQCPSARDLSWEVRVKKESTVNAFCCPGGKIVITTGILKMMEGKKTKHIQRKDLIAAVLGHEITHAIAEHGARSMQISILSNAIVQYASYGLSFLFVPKPKIDENLKGDEKKKSEEAAAKKLAKHRVRFCKDVASICSIPLFFLRTGYSQSHEFEADEFGIQMAHEAGYNIDASVSLQEMFLEMKGQGKDRGEKWFRKVKDALSSHPPSQERLQKNRETIHRLRGLT